MQIPAGTRARMLKNDGVPPTYDTLARLMHIENVSLSWLLGADGPAFLVTRTSSGAESCEEIRLRSEDWGISPQQLFGGGLTAWIFVVPADIQTSKGSIPYQSLEIVAGPSGPAVNAFLAHMDAKSPAPKALDTGGTAMRAVYAGWVGTFALLGDRTHSGIVARGIPVSSSHVAEPTVIYDLPQRLVSAWPTLDDTVRDTITAMLTPIVAPKD